MRLRGNGHIVFLKTGVPRIGLLIILRVASARLQRLFAQAQPRDAGPHHRHAPIIEANNRDVIGQDLKPPVVKRGGKG